MRDRDRGHHLGIWFDRYRLQDGQNDVFDAGKKFGVRVTRSCGVKHKLGVKHVLVAIRAKREDAHAGTKLEVNYVHGRATDADDKVAGAKRVGDGRKNDATLEKEFGSGRVEERSPRRRPPVAGRARCRRSEGGVVDYLAAEAVDGGRVIVEQERHCDMAAPSRARVGGRLAQMRRHLLATSRTDAGQCRTRPATLPPKESARSRRLAPQLELFGPGCRALHDQCS